MIVENQPAWAPHLRSKSLLRQAPKRHFVHSAGAVLALLDVDPKDSLRLAPWFRRFG
jgi:hypothetical protein